MSFERIWALSLRIIRQFIRDKRTLALLFIVPIFVMGLLGYLINYPVGTIRLGVSFSQSNSFLKAQEEMLSTQGFQLTEIPMLEAREKIESGDIYAAIIIPDFVNSKEIELILGGTDPTINGEVMSRLSRFMQGLVRSLPIDSLLPDLKTDYVYGGPDFTSIDYLAPAFISFFVFFFVFLLAVVSFLRERSRGTIERLLVSPLSRLEVVLGYALGFLIFALVQSAIIILFAIYVLQIKYVGSVWLVYLVNCFIIVASVSLGIFLSAFARNELQAIQFIPIVVIPQALLCGFFWPVEQMAPLLRGIAQVLPMTYAIQALKEIMIKGNGFEAIFLPLLVLFLFIIFFFFLASLSVRKQTS